MAAEPVISATPDYTSEPMQAPPSAVSHAEWPWWWAVLPAGLIVLLIAGWFAMRRKYGAQAEFEDEEAAPDVPLVSTPPMRHVPPPAPASARPAPVQAPSPATSEPLGIAFEARKVSATLINTTLAYRMVIANRGSEPLSGLTVAADMAAAHASLPVEQQLATDGQPLELRHEIAALAPGDTIELNGELRLSLSAINPIRSGSALLYIPLVRLRIEGGGASQLATWVVGEAPLKAGGGLQPFRLDLGPRVYAEVSQRQIALAA